jgi:GrpB-like predicted nucleotidyltransferase (UPF0157 family)
MAAPIQVHISAYDPAWPEMAAEQLWRLQVLQSTLIGAYHIGSTSVEGLSAKPVIDLMPIVTSLAELDAKRGEVESLGYIWHGEFGVEDRRFCSLDDAQGMRRVHLHFYERSSPDALRQLAFRDYLRTFRNVASDYEAEKNRARALYPDDSHAYSAEKGAWIRATEATALTWFVGEGRSL